MEAFIVPIFALLMQLIQPNPVVDRITLLPNANGKAGAVIVSTKQGEQTLDSAHATLAIRKNGSLNSLNTSAEEVQKRYGDLLAIQPKQSVSFTLFFNSGTDTLAENSNNTINTIKTTLEQYPSPEISVIGHTDSVGTNEDNDNLSLMRAAKVRTILTEHGLSPADIEAQGRGERELLVNTADEVAEPMNRRVEVNIR